MKIFDWFNKKSEKESEPLDIMMEALEDLREKQEWEGRFVIFGYILLTGLETIAKEKMTADECSKVAAIALEKFKGWVNKEGKWYRPFKKANSIHCDECKFFKHEVFDHREGDCAKPADIKRCFCPENIGTWESECTLRRKPCDINKNCDCAWFEKKQ